MTSGTKERLGVSEMRDVPEQRSSLEQGFGGLVVMRLHYEQRALGLELRV